MNIFSRLKKKGFLPNIQDFWNNFQGYLDYITGWKKGRRFINENDANDLFKAYYGVIYTCIDRRSKAVARTKWKLYTTDTKASRSKIVTSKHKDYLFSLQSLEKSLSTAIDMVEIVDDPILNLLRQVSIQTTPRKSNVLYNQLQLKIGTVTHTDIAGDAYWYVRKGGATGKPFSIAFVPPGNMKPIISENTNSETYGEVIRYEYNAGKEQQVFDPTEIVHFNHFNPYLGTRGFSPTRAACESICLDREMVDFLFDLIANRLKSEMLLTSEGQLQKPAIDSIQAQMEEYRSTKKDKMPILPGNLKPIMLSGNARDLPFIANRKYEREIICNVFAVPIAMLTTESSNRAIQTEIKTEFAENAILPLCENIQEQLNQQYVPMFEDSENKFIAFDDPVPANRELELKERTEYADAGIWIIDEIRHEMNLGTAGIDIPLYHGQPIGTSEETAKAIDEIIAKVRGGRS